MSVLDELQKMEERVQKRLRELEPLVSEYEQLQQLAKRFGIETGADTHGNDRSARTSSRRSAVRRSSGRRISTPANAKVTTNRLASSGTTRSRATTQRARGSRGGGRQEQIVQLVTQNPGISVRELGTQLGVNPTGLYRPVRRLESEGKVRKDGAALHPA
jgi:Winged helix-turn-helix DNA-binding